MSPAQRGAVVAAAAALAMALGAGAALLLGEQAPGARPGAGRPAPAATSLAPSATASAPARSSELAGPGSAERATPEPSDRARAAPATPGSAPRGGRARPDRPGRPPPGRRADVRRLTAQVAAIRGLAARRPVRARVLGPRGLAAKVRQLGFADLDDDRVEADERVLVTLRLAGPDLDLAGLLADLYSEQVRGVYVPQERTLYVRAAAGGLSPATRVTLVHEITHALQDQAFDLVAVREAVEDDTDASLATLALIEGDAVVVQQLWATRHLSDEERLQAGTEALGEADAVLARTPAYLRNTLFFPYLRGAAFVQALHARDGFAAVDAAFGDPPTTTEQVLHPDKYLAGEQAATVAVRGRLGRRWRAAQGYQFGEFDLAELLSPLGAQTAAAAAAGWDGGRLRLWTRGSASALGLALVFDSRADAAEACAALPRWYEQVADARPVDGELQAGDRDHLAVRCGGRRLRAGIAPGARAARALAAP